MKTNQNMIRKMGDFDVSQRTKDSRFNATELVKQWNSHSGMKKDIKDFFHNENTKEFLSALELEENLNGGNYPYLTSRGKNGGTWMHPYLFVKFAMWLNPRFEVKVIKFVYDEMIKYRIEAGNQYKALSSAVQKIVPESMMTKSIQDIAAALNYIIFGKHEKGIRNQFGCESKQRELSDLERKVADLINEGFITSFDALMNYLRRLYNNKYVPKIFELIENSK